MSARSILPVVATVLLLAIGAGVAWTSVGVAWTSAGALGASDAADADEGARADERTSRDERDELGMAPLDLDADAERTSAARPPDVARWFAEPPPADRAAVAGRVVDEGGRGITSAELGLVRAGASDETALVAVALDARGVFAHADLDPGRWTIVAKAPGRESARVELGELRAGAPRTDVVVRLVHPPRARGIVRWPDGAPAVGAEVVVEAIESLPPSARPAGRAGAERWYVHGVPETVATPVLRTRTDARGSFPASLANGTRFRVTARDVRALGALHPEAALRAIGLDVAEREITCAGSIEGIWPPAEELAIALAPRACVVGRVTDARASPVEGVALVRNVAERPDALARAVAPRAASDDEGVYVLDDLALAPTRIAVKPPTKHAATSFTTQGVALVERHDVVLLPFASVEGVVFGVDGLPHAYATVELRATGNDRRIDGPVTIPDEMFEPDATDMALGSVRVSTQADEAGRFRFDDVRPGWIRVSARGTRAFAPAPFEHRIAPGESVTNATLRLEPAGQIHGRATRADGTPIARAGVLCARPRGHAGAQWRTSDTDGTFTFDCVPPGTWNVSLEIEVTDATFAETSAHATVEVSGGTTSEVTLVPR